METVWLLEQFVREGEYRGLAPKTIQQYRWALSRLVIQCPTLPVTLGDLIPVIGDRRLALESKRDLLRCLKTFFSWCESRYDISNVAAELAGLPRRRTMPRILSVDETNHLLNAAKTRRDRSLVLLVLDCGLRLGEVANLRKTDLRDGWLALRGKAGARQVPVSPEIADELITLNAGDYIWQGLRGPLTRDGVKRVYQRLFRNSGIGGPKQGAHTLRHTFGTFYIRAGGGVRQLQQIMGHSRIETTMIYVHLAGLDVAADHARSSPFRTLGLVERLR